MSDKEKNEEIEGNQEISETDLLKLSSDNIDSGSTGDDSVFMRLYSSLMIILMTFFIVLVSLSDVSTEKFQALKEGIDNSFGVFGVESKKGQEMLLNSIASLSRKIDDRKIQSATANDGAMDTQANTDGVVEPKEDGVQKEVLEKDAVSQETQRGGGQSKEEGNTGRSDEEEVGDKEHADYEGDKGDEIDAEELDGKKAKVKDKFLEDGYSNFIIMVSSEMVFLGGEVERKGRELIIRFPSDAVFYTGDIKVKAEIIPVFNRIIKLLEKQEFAKITIRCFSSEKVLEKYKMFSHLAFSCLRAKSVNKIFYKHGIPFEKVQNIGFGDSRHSESKLENNLIEIIIN